MTKIRIYQIYGCARKTFICFALSNGIPPNVVMKYTGHCDYKSMKTYIDEHPALKGLRVSMKNYIDQGWMENLPLYAIEGYLRAEGIPVPEQGE